MLSCFSLEDANQWDRIVKSFAEYDTYWLSGYVKAFKLHGDGEPLLFFYEDEKIRGINVVMKRDIAGVPEFKGLIAEDTYFDFATPYGYGGWLIEGDDSKTLFESYQNWCMDNGIVSEFVRFHPMAKNHMDCEAFYDIVKLGEVVHMELDSPEIIWGNLTSKNRNVIRKAIKNDVRIYNGRYPEIYVTFRDIYNKTMDKDSADDYYYFDKEFYQSVLEDLPENAQVFYAKKKDKIIAASIILGANGKLNYHLSGSEKEYSSLAATNLLLYKAALWGQANGYRTFYLGGGVGSEEDSLFKFKRAFNRGNLNHYYIGKKVFDGDNYRFLVGIREDKLNSENYFPLYRA